MIYLGEFLNSKFLASTNKAMATIAVLLGLATGGLGIATLVERSKIGSMKAEITSKSKAVVEAQEAVKVAKSQPAVEKVPVGLHAIGVFQSRVNKLSIDNKCQLTQFQASDQMNPFISTFTNTQPVGGWTQVEVKMNLQGTTHAVIQTLRDFDKLNIPYEFTSLEISRVLASPTGEATITANVSLRVITIPGGA